MISKPLSKFYSMRYAILFFCFSMTFNLFGQSRKSKRPIYFLKTQGGFLFDAHPNNTYKGFSIFNGGLLKHKNGVLQGFDLELIKYDSDTQKKTDGRRGYGWSREKESIELSYFRSYSVIGDIDKGLFVGGFASAGLSKDFFWPSASSRYKYEEKCLCFGLGIKLDYFFKLKKKIYLDVSTKITLVDFRLDREQRFDPRIPYVWQLDKAFNIDFLRNQFPLMIGLNFRL